MAAGDFKVVYGTKTSMTITLTSLTNNSLRESTVVDNTSNLFHDGILRILTNGQASGTSILNVYLYWGLNDTTYIDGATGTDAAFTAGIRNSILIGTVQMNAATAVKGGIPSIIQPANMLVLPPKWGVIVENKSGATLSATGGDHTVEFQGVYFNTAPS